LTISDKVSSSKSIKDEDLKALIGKPLRESKKSKKSKAAAAETKA
jgi:stalled ribosome alternative rescue factor ArfA